MSKGKQKVSLSVAEVLEFLESKGSESIKRIFENHGAVEPLFGVKVSDMKIIQKQVKTDHELARGLFRTGNSDAMYLAGLIADPKQFSKAELTELASNASWYMISEYAIAWNVAESDYCWELCHEWLKTDNTMLNNCAWAALANFVMLHPDEALDLAGIEALLEYVGKHIHQAPNRVRYVMNGFVIAVGSSVVSLTEKARAIGQKIGKVSVDLGGTACKVPSIVEYIGKVEQSGKLGKKKKTAKC
jgi:3-methyladenine DNA glycosylase AlkD